MVGESFGTPGIMPDEIVIVLSGCDIIAEDYIESFESFYCAPAFDFKVVLVQIKETIFTGEACSIGEQHCTGDIILIQAGDDLCHPRRIEIVKKYFESHDIVALNHAFYGLDMMEYYGKDNLENKFDYDNIKTYQPWEIVEHIKEKPLDVYGQFCDAHIAAGTIVYRRDIVGKFTWSNKQHGQDTITCKRIALKFKKSIIINAPLYYYFK